MNRTAAIRPSRPAMFETTPQRVAAGRIIAGAVLMVSPRRVLRWWTASRDDRAAPLVRAIGARDLALGIGALLALRDGTPARRWFAAAAIADAADVAVSARAARHAPGIGRAAFLVAALAGLRANQHTARRHA